MRKAIASSMLAMILLGCTQSSQITRITPVLTSPSRTIPVGALARLIPGSGTYSREISTDSDLTQDFFDQGLRLTWSFYSPEAIASYQEASRLDPDHPMPYWGIAHAMGPNPDSRYAQLPDDPQGEGLKAINAALARLENGTDQEQDLIKALYVRYNKGDYLDDSERDLAYLNTMRQIHAKYPDDVDIGSMFADSFMTIGRREYWNPDGTPKEGTEEIARVLEQAMRVEPYHPGANHLYIHLMEASAEPERALPAAHKLEQTVPISGHMVHMPSHIYVRVGEYDKAVDANIRSQEVDLQFAEIWDDLPLPNLGNYPLSHRSHAPHALDFVRYAATLQGNYAIALEAAERGAAKVSNDPAAIVASQQRLVHPWLVNRIFRKWDLIISNAPKHSGTPYLDGMRSYVLGSAYAGTDMLPKADVELVKLRVQARSDNVNEYRVGTSSTDDLLTLSAFILEGEIKQAKGNLPGAITAFAAAVEIEQQNTNQPPDLPLPARHYLAAALLEADRAAEAEQLYRENLKWNQHNGWALLGLHNSLRAQEKTEEARIIYRQFESVWKNADIDLER